MPQQYRIFIYAFLSKIFADSLDDEFLEDLSQNQELLETIGENSKTWFASNDLASIKEALNIDFTTIFLMNERAFESAVIDSKEEILVGLQNPVMQFYFNHNYELNLTATHLQTPDHISIELAFMQNLISKNEIKSQIEFLQNHILSWVIPYLIAIKGMCQTPFYADICDFTNEFLASDFQNLIEGQNL